MRVELSKDPRDFVRRDWSDLVAADPTGSFFHTPRYLKLYWEEFGTEAQLALVLGSDGGRTVGIAPFEVAGETLRFLGGTEVTDYMGPLALPGFEDVFAKELVTTVSGIGAWSSGHLEGIPEDSPWLDRLAAAAGSEGLGVEVGDDDVAPLLLLPGTYDEYLAALPSKLRHEIRRKARRLDAETGGHRLAFATADSLVEDLDCFVEMHRSSEGPKGKFMQPGMEIFFRRLGEEFIEEGTFRLGFVEVDGQKLAGAIGFRFGDRFNLYNSAYDHARSALSPGMVLVADLIDSAIEDGCSAFDMLKGDIPYKYRFGARPRRVKKLTLSR